MATPPRHDKTDGAPPREVHVEEKKTNWLAWIALAAGLLALLWFIIDRSNDRNDTQVVDTTVTETATPTNVADTMTAPVASNSVPFTSGLGAYLAGSDATPRTFNFEKLNFDTGKSEVREADRAEIDNIAGSLRDSANARIRVVGYADARGNSATNAALGKARAESVKAALVAQGVAATRIETGSGGEADPVDTNATTVGQAENRRTELVVLSR